MNLCFSDVSAKEVTACCELTNKDDRGRLKLRAACGVAAVPHASTEAIALSLVFV